jgi:hypothetical protein
VHRSRSESSMQGVQRLHNRSAAHLGPRWVLPGVRGEKSGRLRYCGPKVEAVFHGGRASNARSFETRGPASTQDRHSFGVAIRAWSLGTAGTVRRCAGNGVPAARGGHATVLICIFVSRSFGCPARQTAGRCSARRASRVRVPPHSVSVRNGRRATDSCPSISVRSGSGVERG